MNTFIYLFKKSKEFKNSSKIDFDSEKRLYNDEIKMTKRYLKKNLLFIAIWAIKMRITHILLHPSQMTKIYKTTFKCLNRNWKNETFYLQLMGFQTV